MARSTLLLALLALALGAQAAAGADWRLAEMKDLRRHAYE